ncbi:MAG: rhodanese-like domain-containing protein [Dehalococcoidia bacterium]
MMQRIFRARTGSRDVSVQEASRRQADGAVIVDVREADEWATGHVPGARHAPLSRLHVASLPRDADLLIICRSGGRSARAVTALRQAGYTRAVNVAGGMTAWSAAGLPVAR